MDDLIEKVEAYRRAEDVEQKVQLANLIAREIYPPLALFTSKGFSQNRMENAEDVLQEILVACIRGLDRCRAQSKKEFWGFCYSIARNQLAERFRKRGLDLVDPPTTEELEHLIDGQKKNSSFDFADEHDLEYALALLAAAKPPCKELLVRHYLQGVDYGEIGLELGVAPDTVRMRIKRCLDLAGDLVKKKQRP